MSSREAGRTIDLPVKFQQAFASHPKIAIATSLLDVEAGSPSGFSADVIEVSHKGIFIMELRFYHQSDSIINQAHQLYSL